VLRSADVVPLWYVVGGAVDSMSSSGSRRPLRRPDVNVARRPA
jgi:hypothetical protein